MERLSPRWSDLSLHQPAFTTSTGVNTNERLGWTVHVHGGAKSGSEVCSDPKDQLLFANDSKAPYYSASSIS